LPGGAVGKKGQGKSKLNLNILYEPYTEGGGANEKEGIGGRGKDFVEIRLSNRKLGESIAFEEKSNFWTSRAEAIL